MVERILKLIEQKELSCHKIEKDLNFGNGAIKRFATNIPSIDKIKELAAYLNVSIDYLVNGDEKEQSVIKQSIIGNQNKHNTITINGNAPKELPEIESELIKICASLDTRKKNALLAYAYELENK